MRLRIPVLLGMLALAWSAHADEFISYQGHLELQGQPFSGQADISFDFFDSPEGGSLLIGSFIPGVEVNDGLFQVELPAQSLGQSGEVWLQITVDGDALADRQRLRPVPQALYSGRVDTGYTDQFYWRRGGNAGTDPAQDYIGTVDDTPFHIRTDGQTVLRLEAAGSLVIDGVGSRGATFSLFNLIGGHPDNQIFQDGAGSVISGGGGPAPDFHNEAGGALVTIGGGMDNRVSVGLGTIGGGLGNRVHGESGTIAGGQGNRVLIEGGTVSGGVGNFAESFSSTVAGGGSNVAAGSGSVVSGGQQNQAQGQHSVVAGGHDNLAAGNRSTVSGGQGNEASGNDSAIAGGQSATASGTASFVGGGTNNRAEGVNSVVLGGWGNLAEAGFSVAAGRLAQAVHPFSFVWSDGLGGAFQSEVDREFAVRAAGGVRKEVGHSRFHFTPGGDDNIGREAGGNVILGHALNAVSEGIFGAVISGGGSEQGTTDQGNRVEAHFGTVGGGRANVISDQGGMIGGGSGNLASGQFATIAGGNNSTAAGEFSSIGGGAQVIAAGDWATVGGGRQVSASGDYASVGGGHMNVASGRGATIPGGRDNQATGEGSFAAGRWARSNHNHSFVWSDNSGLLPSNRLFTSETNNEFAVRAAGGVRLVTNVNSDGDPTSGVFLAPGGSAWGSVSDRNAKMAIEYPAPGQVLQSVLALPIAEYSYRSQDESIRHMGPMAQDFFPLFGLGENELRVNAVNLAGISLAAIQGLHAELESERATNQRLSGELAALRARVDEMSAQQAETSELKDRLARLEAVLLDGPSVAGK